MTANNVGALLVTKSEADGAIAGIVTERGESPSIWFLEDLVCKHFFSASLLVCVDYLRKIIVQGRSSKTTKVGEIMTEEVSSGNVMVSSFRPHHFSPSARFALFPFLVPE